MSFEGYYQILCKNGHLSTEDCYTNPNLTLDEDNYPWRCPCCNELATWYNVVDVTNGSFCECNVDYLERSKGCKFCDHGRIDGVIDLELEEPSRYSTCEHCGQSKLLAEAIYKIPSDKGYKVVGWPINTEPQV